MEIEDRVFGANEINEQVLIDIINSNALRRIKGVTQQGLPEKYYGKPTFSRYEHSLGVFLGLRKLGADIKEQIAGLTHDISHTTFSHLIDHILGNPNKDDYQDSIHLQVMRNSDIPTILRDHGFDFQEFINHNNFRLLENEIPNLCMDRFDYAVRDDLVVSQRGADLEKVVGGLIVHQGSMAFNSESSAMSFALNYVNSQINNWSSDDGRARYYMFSEALKIGLKKRLIEKRDFLGTEEVIFQKIKGKDSQIDNILELLENGFEVREVQERGIVAKFKPRYIDPLVYDGRNKPMRLSNLSKDYMEILEEQKQVRGEKKLIIQGFELQE